MASKDVFNRPLELLVLRREVDLQTPALKPQAMP